MDCMLKKHLLLLALLFWGNNFSDGLQYYEDYDPDVSEESTTLTVQDKTVQSTDNSFTIKVAIGGSLGGGGAVIIIGLTICKRLIKRRNNKNNYGDKSTELQVFTPSQASVMERNMFFAEERNGCNIFAWRHERHERQ